MRQQRKPWHLKSAFYPVLTSQPGWYWTNMSQNYEKSGGHDRPQHRRAWARYFTRKD